MTNKKKKQTSKLKISKGKRPILFLSWEDHCKRGYDQGWTHSSDRKMSPMLCEAVGFKIYEDKKVLVLALTQDPNGSFGETMHIIKSCIKKRRILG